jgi:hypothetical protein
LFRIYIRQSTYIQLSFILVLSGCFAPRVIPISYTSGSSSPSIEQSSDYSIQAAAIASALVSELKLPSFETVLYVYPTLNDFNRAFAKEVDDLAETPLHSDVVATLAVCSHKKILAYWSSQVPWTVRIKSLAHEMTHLSHFALGKWSCGRPGHAWLMEGFANWMAFRILESLSVDTFKAGRDDFLGGVRTFRSKQEFPSLKLLSPYRDWLNMLQTYGYSGTYQQSFFAVDYLIERNGLESVVKYFTLFEQTADADENFKAAFGVEFSDFESDFISYLAKLLFE